MLGVGLKGVSGGGLSLMTCHVMLEDWVRHEVAVIIVVHRNTGDATRCPISGILRRCAGR